MASQTVRKPAWLSGTFGEMVGEFFGTMVLILFGDGVNATFTLFAPFANEWIVIVLGWGLAVMLGVYVAGAISGAHINPAVTLAMAVRGKLPWSKVLPYWFAQLLGAFLAAAILYFDYQGALVHALHGQNISTFGGIFYTSKQPFVGMFGAFCDQFIGTALLVGLIFAIVDARNQPVQGNLNPFIIGLVVVAIGSSFGLNTGYAINPARDFGPRLWVTLAGGGLQSLNYYTWVPILGPLAGGVVGALIYDFTIAKVLEAKQLGKSGDTTTQGEAVREPAPDARIRGGVVREEPSIE
jgi:glycerol uptake facilitator protein